MKRLVAIMLLTSLVSLSCHDDDVVVAPVGIPDNALAGTTPFGPATRAALEGIYRVVQGNEAFGEFVALKWSGMASGPDTNCAPLLMSPSGPIPKDSVTITGSWGSGEGAPNRSIVLRYDRPLYKGKRFDIIAHRGGGRI